MRKVKYFIKQLVASFVDLNEDLGWEIAHDLMDESHSADELKANILDAAMDYLSSEEAHSMCEELFAGISIVDIEAWMQDRDLKEAVDFWHRRSQRVA